MVFLVVLRCFSGFPFSYGVPRCYSLTYGVYGSSSGSRLSYVVPRVSSLSYGVPCSFFVFLRCSYGVPRGFSLSYGVPRFNRSSSLFFGVPLRYSFSYGVLLHCSPLLYGVTLGSLLFFFFSAFLWVSRFLQCSSCFFFALRCPSGFFVVLWGFSVFGFLQGSGLLMVPQRSLFLYGVLRDSSLFWVFYVLLSCSAVLFGVRGFCQGNFS